MTNLSRLLYAALLLTLLASCVPKSQFDALAAERDDYRDRMVRADSLANAHTRTNRDSLQEDLRTQGGLVRQIEQLTATNLVLKAQVDELQERYEALLQQQEELVAAGGGGTAGLENELANRRAQLDRREAELEQATRELAARESSLASIDEMRNRQPGQARGTSPVDPTADAVVTADKIHNELRQLLLAATDTGYVLERPGPFSIALTLDGSLLLADANTLSTTGQRIVRRLGATLKNYPMAEFTIVAHDETGSDAGDAYRTGFDRAVLVATELARYGVDAGRIVAGSKGLYGSGGARSTELRIRIPE